MPTLTTSTQLYSFKQNHIFTPAELNFSQGFPLDTIEQSRKYLPCCLGFNFESGLTAAQHKDLTGDGQHLVQIAAWWLYVCSNLMRRSEITGPVQSCLVSASDKDDSDFEFE